MQTKVNAETTLTIGFVACTTRKAKMRDLIRTVADTYETQAGRPNSPSIGSPNACRATIHHANLIGWHALRQVATYYGLQDQMGTPQKNTSACADIRALKKETKALEEKIAKLELPDAGHSGQAKIEFKAYRNTKISPNIEAHELCVALSTKEKTIRHIFVPCLFSQKRTISFGNPAYVPIAAQCKENGEIVFEIKPTTFLERGKLRYRRTEMCGKLELAERLRFDDTHAAENYLYSDACFIFSCFKASASRPLHPIHAHQWQTP